jgi:hypothetical protein
MVAIADGCHCAGLSAKWLRKLGPSVANCIIRGAYSPFRCQPEAGSYRAAELTIARKSEGLNASFNTS